MGETEAELAAAGSVERVLWLILILLVVGYMVGTWLNRRRSKRIGAWVQTGLGKLGGRVAWRFIRGVTSGAEANIGDARPPYRQLTIGYFLLTREVSPLWAIERLRNKSDLLTLRADLRRMPGVPWEIVPLQGPLRRKLDQVAETPLNWQPLAAGLGLATGNPADPALVRRATAFTERYGTAIERLSLRQRTPHLVAFIKLQAIESRPLTEFWAALDDLLI